MKTGKKRGGFSLIEVIVGLGIALVAVLLFGAVLGSIPLTHHARNQNVAYHIAAKKIEELRATPFAALPPSGPFTDPGLADLAGSSAELAVGDYQGSGEIRHVTAIVYWQDESGLKSIQLDTLIADGGVSQQ